MLRWFYRVGIVHYQVLVASIVASIVDAAAVNDAYCNRSLPPTRMKLVQ